MLGRDYNLIPTDVTGIKQISKTNSPTRLYCISLGILHSSHFLDVTGPGAVPGTTTVSIIFKFNFILRYISSDDGKYKTPMIDGERQYNKVHYIKDVHKQLMNDVGRAQ